MDYGPIGGLCYLLAFILHLVFYYISLRLIVHHSSLMASLTDMEPLNDPSKSPMASAPDARSTCAALPKTTSGNGDNFPLTSGSCFLGLLAAATVVGGNPAGFALHHSQEPHIRFLKSNYATKYILKKVWISLCIAFILWLTLFGEYPKNRTLHCIILTGQICWLCSSPWCGVISFHLWGCQRGMKITRWRRKESRLRGLNWTVSYRTGLLSGNVSEMGASLPCTRNVMLK